MALPSHWEHKPGPGLQVQCDIHEISALTFNMWCHLADFSDHRWMQGTGHACIISNMEEYLMSSEEQTFSSLCSLFVCCFFFFRKKKVIFLFKMNMAPVLLVSKSGQEATLYAWTKFTFTYISFTSCGAAFDFLFLFPACPPPALFRYISNLGAYSSTFCPESYCSCSDACCCRHITVIRKPETHFWMWPSHSQMGKKERGGK